jgi:hypothetical protein
LSSAFARKYQKRRSSVGQVKEERKASLQLVTAEPDFEIEMV